MGISHVQGRPSVAANRDLRWANQSTEFYNILGGRSLERDVICMAVQGL